MAENVTLTRSGPLATVTLTRPDLRNSLSDPLLIELGAALAELRDDATTRVVVLTGAPPVFSSGAHSDIKRGMSDEERRHVFSSKQSQFRRFFERATGLLENLEQATICAINGHAIGGGWGLTLACDFRIAAEGAQFWLPEVDLGSPLGTGSTTRLIRMVGSARTREIIMTCRRYSASDLASWGLVNQVTPLANLDQTVAEWADLLLKKPFKALAEVKARINTISATAVPSVNAMTEAFLARE